MDREAGHAAVQAAWAWRLDTELNRDEDGERFLTAALFGVWLFFLPVYIYILKSIPNI